MRVADSSEAKVGLKVTLRLQFAPTARVVVQVVPAAGLAKSAALVPVIVMAIPASAVAVLFVRVIV